MYIYEKKIFFSKYNKIVRRKRRFIYFNVSKHADFYF